MKYTKKSGSRRATTVPTLDLQKHRGRWVAIDPTTHRIVADGESLVAAEQAAHDQGIDRPLLLAVPRSDAFFVGNGL